MESYKPDAESKKRQNSYLKNVSKGLGKSFKREIIESNLPELSEMYVGFKESALSGRGTFANTYKALRETVRYVKRSIWDDLLVVGTQNAIEDLKTGNVNNEQRAEDEFMGDDFGFDETSTSSDESDFGGWDEEDSNGEDNVVDREVIDQRKTMVTKINMNGNKPPKPEAEMVVNSKMQIVTSMMIGQNTLASLRAIYKAEEEKAKFRNTHTAKHYTAAETFYDTATKTLGNIGTSLERIRETLEKQNGYSNNVENSRKEDKSLLGRLDKWKKETFGEYSMFGMFAGQIKNNPLGFILDSAMDLMIPADVQNSLQDLDKLFKKEKKGFVNKLSGLKESDNYLFRFVGNMFNSFKGNKKVDDNYLAKFEKKATPFDTDTKRSIVMVIPTYLRKILKAVEVTAKSSNEDMYSKSQELFFDTKAGKFIKEKKFNTKLDSDYFKKMRKGFTDNDRVSDLIDGIEEDAKKMKIFDKSSFEKEFARFYGVVGKSGETLTQFDWSSPKGRAQAIEYLIKIKAIDKSSPYGKTIIKGFLQSKISSGDLTEGIMDANENARDFYKKGMDPFGNRALRDASKGNSDNNQLEEANTKDIISYETTAMKKSNRQGVMTVAESENPNDLMQKWIIGPLEAAFNVSSSVRAEQGASYAKGKIRLAKIELKKMKRKLLKSGMLPKQVEDFFKKAENDLGSRVAKYEKERLEEKKEKELKEKETDADGYFNGGIVKNGFADGGIIKTGLSKLKELTGLGIKPHPKDDTIISAQIGEGILTKQAVRFLGAEGLETLNELATLKGGKKVLTNVAKDLKGYATSSYEKGKKSLHNITDSKKGKEFNADFKKDKTFGKLDPELLNDIGSVIGTVKEKVLAKADSLSGYAKSLVERLKSSAFAEKVNEYAYKYGIDDNVRKEIADAVSEGQYKKAISVIFQSTVGKFKDKYMKKAKDKLASYSYKRLLIRANKKPLPPKQLIESEGVMVQLWGEKKYEELKRINLAKWNEEVLNGRIKKESNVGVLEKMDTMVSTAIDKVGRFAKNRWLFMKARTGFLTPAKIAEMNQDGMLQVGMGTKQFVQLVATANRGMSNRARLILQKKLTSTNVKRFSEMWRKDVSGGKEGKDMFKYLLKTIKKSNDPQVLSNLLTQKDQIMSNLATDEYWQKQRWMKIEGAARQRSRYFNSMSIKENMFKRKGVSFISNLSEIPFALAEWGAKKADVFVMKRKIDMGLIREEDLVDMRGHLVTYLGGGEKGRMEFLKLVKRAQSVTLGKVVFGSLNYFARKARSAAGKIGRFALRKVKEVFNWGKAKVITSAIKRQIKKGDIDKRDLFEMKENIIGLYGSENKEKGEKVYRSLLQNALEKKERENSNSFLANIMRSKKKNLLNIEEGLKKKYGEKWDDGEKGIQGDYKGGITQISANSYEESKKHTNFLADIKDILTKQNEMTIDSDKQRIIHSKKSEAKRKAELEKLNNEKLQNKFDSKDSSGSLLSAIKSKALSGSKSGSDKEEEDGGILDSILDSAPQLLQLAGIGGTGAGSGALIAKKIGGKLLGKTGNAKKVATTVKRAKKLKGLKRLKFLKKAKKAGIWALVIGGGAIATKLAYDAINNPDEQEPEMQLTRGPITQQPIGKPSSLKGILATGPKDGSFTDNENIMSDLGIGGALSAGSTITAKSGVKLANASAKGVATKGMGKILGKAAVPLAFAEMGYEAYTGARDAELYGNSMIDGGILGATTGGQKTGSIMSESLGMKRHSFGDKALGVGAAATQAALTGAMIGSIFPGVGTAAGAIGGAIIGGGMELYKNYKEGQKFEEITKNTFSGELKVRAKALSKINQWKTKSPYQFESYQSWMILKKDEEPEFFVDMRKQAMESTVAKKKALAQKVAPKLEAIRKLKVQSEEYSKVISGEQSIDKAKSAISSREKDIRKKLGTETTLDKVTDFASSMTENLKAATTASIEGKGSGKTEELLLQIANILKTISNDTKLSSNSLKIIETKKEVGPIPIPISSPSEGGFSGSLPSEKMLKLSASGNSGLLV